MSSEDSSQRLNWRLLARFLRPHRRQLAALAGILAATIVVQLAAPLVTGRFVDAAVGGAGTEALLGLAGLALALSLLGQGIAVAETWVAERVAWGATNALREHLAAHVLGLDMGFHHAHAAGHLIERVDGDVGTLARLFSRFAIYVVGNALLVVGVLALLVAVDWRVGLGMALVVAAAVAAMLKLRAAATPAAAAERQAAAEVYGFLGEHLAGREDIRANGAVAFVQRGFADLMDAWLAARTRAGMGGYALLAAGQGIFGLGTAFAFAAGAVLYREGALTIGAVFLVVRYAEMLRQPTEQIREEIQDLQQAAAGLGRIDALLAVRSRLVDGPRDRLPPGALAIDLDRVRFGYDPAVPVLRGVSLHIPAGRVLGVVGRTGSGKTTLTRLLPRFIDPDAGSVRLGGVDLRDATVAAVRARVGVAAQHTHLFHASVRDNLTLFDKGMPDDRLRELLAALGMEPWLAALPDGLDTVLGPDGAMSAGQGQILACARLLLRNPDVVVLDEPSAKLDPATERLVHRAFERLLEGRTGVVVAHRLATVALADDILVMDRGEVVERGDRLALAANPSSRYAGLLRLAAEEVVA